MTRETDEEGGKGTPDRRKLQAVSATLTQAYGAETFEGLDPSLANLMIQLSHFSISDTAGVILDDQTPHRVRGVQQAERD